MSQPLVRRLQSREPVFAPTTGAPDAAASRSTPKEAPHRKYQRRNAKLRAIGYQTYGAYLQSPHWKQTRARYRASELPQTCVCGSDDVHLHHLTYDRVGDERLSDLTPLCPSCHSLVHVLEWRGDLDIGLDGLADEERAIVGRAWLAAEADRLRREAEQREQDRRAAVLAQPFATRLVNAVSAAKRRRVDVSHRVHLLQLAAKSGQSDEQLTRKLRIIEAKAYGWDDWA